MKWLNFKAWLFGFPMTFRRHGMNAELKEICLMNYTITGIYTGELPLGGAHVQFSINKYDLQGYRK